MKVTDAFHKRRRHALRRKYPSPRELRKTIERLDEEINRLSQFIIMEVPGEPSQDQGAINTAIRLIRDSRKSRRK